MNQAVISQQAEEEKIPRITLKTFFLYILALAVPGYLFNATPMPNATPDVLKGLIWFTYFMMITFGFKSIWHTILPLLDIRSFKKGKTYIYILMSLVLPYSFLHLCLHYGFFLDKYYIFAFYHHMIPATSIGVTIDSTLLTPIFEELLFRGVLLVFLLTFMKPYMAVGVIAIFFGIIHPPDTWIFMVLPSVLLTITAYKTKSLLPSILAHGLWNLYMAQLFLYF